MKLNKTLTRRFGLGLLGVLLVAGMAFVLTRTGPLAPVRITVHQVGEGTLTPRCLASARSRPAAPI